MNPAPRRLSGILVGLAMFVTGTALLGWAVIQIAGDAVAQMVGHDPSIDEAQMVSTIVAGFALTVGAFIVGPAVAGRVSWRTGGLLTFALALIAPWAYVWTSGEFGLLFPLPYDVPVWPALATIGLALAVGLAYPLPRYSRSIRVEAVIILVTFNAIVGSLFAPRGYGIALITLPVVAAVSAEPPGQRASE